MVKLPGEQGHIKGWNLIDETDTSRNKNSQWEEKYSVLKAKQLIIPSDLRRPEVWLPSPPPMEC